MLVPGGIVVIADDLAGEVDAQGPGEGRLRKIHLREPPAAQEEPVLVPGGVVIIADDLSVVVDPMRRGKGRVRVVDRRELATAQQIAVSHATGVDVVAHNHTSEIDPLASRERGAGDVKERESAPTKHETVSLAKHRGVVLADDCSRVINALRNRLDRSRHIDLCENSRAQDVAVEPAEGIVEVAHDRARVVAATCGCGRVPPGTSKLV